MTSAGAKPKRMLIVGINYVPEQVGIGPYTAELATTVAAAGYGVEVITAKPYYPAWRTWESYKGSGYASSMEDGVRVVRCPIYVPALPTGVRRVLHHLSFAASILPPLLATTLLRRPNLVFVVAPSMISAPVARLFARLCGAPAWLHVQDFEVGAAMATGLIAAHGWRASLARAFETYAYSGFDYASSISPQMCARLETFRSRGGPVIELRNWANLEEIQPIRPSQSSFCRDWKLEGVHVVLYSGNISKKQGLEGVVEAASKLAHRPDISFVICGDGPGKQALMRKAAGLRNLHFHDLQPRERLCDLLGTATLHLLPQIPGAADLVLPSKLTNILASGKPVIATAAPGTSLEREVEGCGLCVSPGNPGALADAVRALVDDPATRERMAATARARAIDHWSKHSILDGFLAQLRQATSVAPRLARSRSVGRQTVVAE
jgi:colanic acid biosynthesis glycosyl transferase WcaI